MNFWSSLSGMLEVRLTSAEPAGAISAINQAGIEMFHTMSDGELTLCLTLRRTDYKRLRRLIKKRGERIQILRHHGLYWTIRQLTVRPVLLAGVSLILFMTLYLPMHIYFVEVQGNVTVPASLIVEKAESCGIVFGVDRRDIRSETIKNALLQAVPELQWAGVNTYGCRAVICVRERPQEEKFLQKGNVSSIVASRDGVIQQITVRNGNRVCAVGQAVKAGQILISGYTDCGICIRATSAEGEVFAQTRRDLTTIFPQNFLKKGKYQHQERNYSLLIGKKLINFRKGSGISTSGCDKMYSVDYITLPGNLRLPVALVTETVVSYDASEDLVSKDTAQRIVNSCSTRYLSDTMIAGKIIQRIEYLEFNDAVCILRGRYACVEMIGKTRFEENIHDYGQTH